MRTLVSILLAVVVLGAGAGGAYYFRKPPGSLVPVAQPWADAPSINDYRATPRSVQPAGPVPAALLDHPVPRLLGRIEELPAQVRPLGVAQDAPPQLPETFITNNGAFEAGVFDE